MKRRPLNALSAASLAVLVALLAAYALGWHSVLPLYREVVRVEGRVERRTRWTVFLATNTLVLERERNERACADAPRSTAVAWGSDRKSIFFVDPSDNLLPRPLARWGVVFYMGDVGPAPPDAIWYLELPYPALLLVTAAMAWPAARRLVKGMARRPRAGHCARCGYDLRATPERCPECGSPAAEP